ncbi:heme exporter protein CcmD [Dryocola sp. BD613]|uniref:heme exporter protein CcmD n=1 Tax=Dryocola sp. BD613 TaxID=3133272 RepID=UPI003F4FFE00
MKGAFTSWAEFLAMGGYAFYVWLAVAFTVIPLLALVVHTALQRRKILNGVERQQARERRIRAQQQTEAM